MGLILLNKSTMQVKYFNENNGLQNNTVLSLGFDSRENLWAGLDNGIDYICLNSPLSNLYSYPCSYGAGYSAILSGSFLYLGTNRGLYYTHYPISLNDKPLDIRHVPQSSGQVWDLCRVGNDIFCLHDRGVFWVKGETMKRIGSISGVWNCKIMGNNPDKVLLGLYDGIYLMQKEKGEWKLKKRMEGMNDSAENFEFESDNVIWLHNNDKGFDPLFPFGYGLSYTTFQYSNLKISSKEFALKDEITVTFDLKNTGNSGGTEVAQLYVRDKAGSVTRPVKELKRFIRVALKPGETKNVSFKLPIEELAFWNIDMKRVVEPGDFTLWVGTNSKEGISVDFRVKD